ncbi:MAG: DUF4342 domain-containing protein [Clostridium sp.]|nr:DUF4342 domain-containing protein [Clostridium sp.]MCI7442892.1 DUF4342 domain-containing protein [Clostridium sp.]
MEIKLEDVDKVIERTGVSYKEAKEALEMSDGDIVDAIIYLQENLKNNKLEKEEKGQTIEEFKLWLKELINKGNIARIKIKKDEQVLVDVPVNAGIAATVIGLIIPPLLAFGVIAAVATKVTIEITKTDGSIEVVNKYVSKAADGVVNKASNMAEEIKNKFSGVNINKKDKKDKKDKVEFDNNAVFTYRVDFDDEEEKEN